MAEEVTIKEEYDYLIIGGGIAGTTAADTIRQNDPQGSIAIISDEPYRLYSRIMLSKPQWFLGKIPDEKIWLKDENWYTENKIDLLAGKKATLVDFENKLVTLDTAQEINYQKLLLATGACPRPWPVKGHEKSGIFNLRSFDDGHGLREVAAQSKQAVLVGGGFISFEMADLLSELGLKVTVLIREPNYWSNMLEVEASQIIEKAMQDKGVTLLANTEVTEVLGDDKVSGVLLNNGEQIDCDVIVCGIGVTCPLETLLSDAIETNRGIIANEFLETNQPDVWTAGDVAEYRDLILDETTLMPNWLNAQRQGQLVGLNMVGQKQAFELVTHYSSKGFGVNITFVGDARPGEDKTSINRNSAKDNSAARILVKDKEVIGASLINCREELGVIKKLIEQNIDVSGHLDELANPEFDLNTLLHD